VGQESGKCGWNHTQPAVAGTAWDSIMARPSGYPDRRRRRRRRRHRVYWFVWQPAATSPRASRRRRRVFKVWQGTTSRTLAGINNMTWTGRWRNRENTEVWHGIFYSHPQRKSKEVCVFCVTNKARIVRQEVFTKLILQSKHLAQSKKYKS
jgi:hypothetical protein